MGLLPSVLLLTGTLFAAFYPLTRASHAQAREEIAARRENK
jgi:Na+/melibiose symporter-like transporter